MGKSDIVSLPLERTDPKVLDLESSKKKIKLPDNMNMLENQVAGHVNDGKSIGMIKFGDKVLKPILKKECGEREIYFYKMLKDTVDPSLLELREFVPMFYGVKPTPINGCNIDCIILDDVTKHFKEPCIMDVKIGRRTWGPDSGYKKIMREQMKYFESKRDFAFCVPGFQVYNITTNQCVRYGKDYGKLLNGDTIEDAFKIFLNADSGFFCRSLIMQLLGSLWRIQHWARNQRRLRLYSSSILIVYDARRLRECLKRKSPLKLTRKNSLYRPMSLAVLNNGSERIPTGFSGQLTKEGPILKPPCAPHKILLDAPPVVNNNNIWQKSIKSLRRTHSFQNNYDEDVQNKKQDYTYILDELSMEDKSSEVWAVVKMIDFAHAHPAVNCDIDRNYLEGIENLVRLFEEFLVESE